MKPVILRNIEIGDGIPKICVPIVGETKEDILQAAKKIGEGTMSVDMVEWRADWFKDVFCFEKVENILTELRNALKEIPLLFTFRTLGEGGKKEIDHNPYADLIKKAINTGDVDAVDVEMFMGNEIAADIIKTARFRDVKVIISNHDFKKTPDKQEIVSRLRRMQDMGADIMKIAVMPENKKDVLTLLAATEEMKRLYAKRPVITMSMSGQGVISRICGEIFGSAVTFGSMGKASAPGQIETEDLNKCLRLIHQHL